MVSSFIIGAAIVVSAAAHTQEAGFTFDVEAETESKMKSFHLIGAAIVVSAAAHTQEAGFTFDVEVETKPEMISPPLHSPAWLKTAPDSKIAKLGYSEGSISPKGGLVFRTKTNAHIIECNAVSSTHGASAATENFQARTIQCSHHQQHHEDSSFRFKSSKAPTTLGQKLATPHGSYGGWLPFNSHLQLVPWPAPVASYMMAYQGVYGCMIPVPGHSMCPPDQLLGPFSMQTTFGQPLFLNPQDAPFIPAVDNVAAGDGGGD